MRFLCLAFVLLWPVVAVAADFNAGLRAHERGDYATAMREWRPLAEQGDALAQTFLGSMYAKGEGVPENDRKAVKWYRKAAEQGHAAAQFGLGSMYDKGEGVPKDNRETVKWYRKAAAQGLAIAQVNLGFMYAMGEGVPQDYVQAYVWFNLAAAQGDAKAAKNKSIVEKYMTPSQIARAQSLSTALAQRIRGGGPNAR